LLELCREWCIVNVLVEDLMSWGLRRWALVLPTIIVAAPVRVVATASTILLVPLARVEDVAHVIVVVDAIMDRWGLVPHFLLFRVDRSLLLMWWRWCRLVGLRSVSPRCEAFDQLHRSTLEEGTQLLMGLLSLQG
jgi:hypothetical protein